MRISVRVTGWGTDDSDLVRREDALAKCIFAVTLMKRAMVLGGHADEEMERIASEDRRKYIRLGTDPVFVVTQHKDAGFGSIWEELFIPLDREDTHSGNGMRGALFTECTILAKGNFAVGVEGFKPTFFILITPKPDFAIRMQVNKSLQEGRWTFFVEIKSTHK
jgi:hypothetical protein